jgi:hypothetical protein
LSWCYFVHLSNLPACFFPSFSRTKRLKETQKKTGSNSSSNSRNIALAAKQIEARLFVTASSMEEYRDPSTLRDRFHQMVTYMLERRLQKAEAAAAKSASPAYRLKVLSSIVNPEVSRQAFFLVKQIEFLQVGKPTQRERSLGPPTATTRVVSPSFHLGGQQTVPKPVRDVFFEASIVRAFYFTPLERLKDIPWKRLIASTRREIREYHEWIAESKAD